tara:strand:+ start:867 stop:1916 length:1050 start_codon:yes stop_codon:yes gene_type:complete
MTKAAELAKMGEVLTNSQIGGRRNVIINGAAQVAQRSTSVTGIGASGGYFTVDRFKVDFSGSAGRFTMSQSTDTPDGFGNSIKLDCTTADTSIGASEIALFQYLIEGQDLQQFKKGTSDAEKMTLSFYVKGNGNATYVMELYDNDNARQISKTFSVTSSWTRVVLTYDGDTTGAFGNDNALSLYAQIWLHAGSNFTSGTLSDSWSSVTSANRAVGISSFYSSTDNEFYITGLQLEVGEKATPFEHLSVGETQALCERYYYQSPIYTDYPAFNYAGNGITCVPLSTHMRASPSITDQTGSTYYEAGSGRSYSPSDAGANPEWVRVRGTVSGGTSGYAGTMYPKFIADAEL